MKLPVASTAQTRRGIVELLRANRLYTWLTFGTQLVSIVCAIALPWLAGHTLDVISAGASARWVMWAIVIMAALVVVRIAAMFASEYFAGVLGEDIFKQLREQIVYRVTHLPLSKVEQAGSGDLLGRVTFDVRRVQMFFNSGLSTLLQISLMGIVTYVAALVTVPSLGWIVLLPFPFILLTMRRFLDRASPLVQANTAIVADLSGQLAENAQSALTIESQGLSGVRIRLLERNVEGQYNIGVTMGLTRMGSMGALNALLMSPLVLLVVFGAIMIPRGLTTVGAVMTVAMYAMQLRAPFSSAMFWVVRAQTAWASMRRVVGVGLVPPDREPVDGIPCGRELRLQDVRFNYGSGPDVLKGVSLDVRPGETIAVVGASGAGKSTMARLIAGIDGPTSGSVTIGGMEVTKMTEDVLHSQVALVTQEHHVFTGTLRHNLLLASDGATDNQLWSALADVEADWAHDLSDGLDTHMGAGGVSLTSAQAQQLALARLVLMDPHTLILDEATSMMDPSSAHKLERALGRVLHGRTVIMIAHRLFTARDADRICIMQDGQIAELGSHDELIALDGLYARLWKAWKQQ